MAVHSSSGRHNRRERWAKRQNAPLQRAYEQALELWRRQDDLMRWMAASARAPGGAKTPWWLHLRDDETVLWTAPGAKLVDACRWSDLRPPFPLGFRPPAPAHSFGGLLPDEIDIIETGPVAVTDQRIVFAGARHRTWFYDQLAGVADLGDVPCTMFKEPSADSASGILVELSLVRHFRFALAMGLATALRQRDRFAEHLMLLADAHRKALPIPPAHVGPRDAPRLALAVLRTLASLITGPAGSRLPRRLAHVSTTIALVATIGVLAFLLPDRSPREDVVVAPPAPSRSSSPSATPRPTSTANPLPSGTSTPTTSPRPTITPTPTPTPTRTPRPTPAPTRTTPSLCGAPANPYGYNFCAGSLVYEPADDICDYFVCAWKFWKSRGYLVQCSDNLITLAGDSRGACARNGGVRRPVHQR